jgi:hypothetical protein
MQHIPDSNLDDIERSRVEMEAFRKERKVAREKDERAIIAVKCLKCEQMLTNLREHPCL